MDKGLKEQRNYDHWSKTKEDGANGGCSGEVLVWRMFNTWKSHHTSLLCWTPSLKEDTKTMYPILFLSCSQSPALKPCPHLFKTTNHQPPEYPCQNLYSMFNNGWGVSRYEDSHCPWNGDSSKRICIAEDFTSILVCFAAYSGEKLVLVYKSANVKISKSYWVGWTQKF